MDKLKFVYFSSSVSELVLTSYIQFWISDSNGPWDDDWGTSFLAVLRQQCGVQVEDWTWGFTDGNYWETGGGYFQLSNGWPDKCVENSIWITSDGRGGAIGGVTCIWVN